LIQQALPIESFANHDLRHTYDINSDQLEFTVLEFLKEFWLYMKERKKFWLMPIIVILVLVTSLLILAQGTVVAPFIYTLF
jgi:hypothetical protein